MDEPRNPKELENLIKYSFNDTELLIRALTTPSFANEHFVSSDKIMNALATLGDAVLDVVVIQSLMDAGVSSKGKITKEKAEKVKNSALPHLVERLGLIEFVHWGEGQKKQEHWKSDDLASDCLEALIGAVYLDSARNMNVAADVFKTIDELSW